jgi:hypothetical protein
MYVCVAHLEVLQLISGAYLEGEFTNVFSQYRVDSRSLRSTISYEFTLMEFTDNLSKPPDFFFIQTVTKDEWISLYKIIN